MGIPTRLFHNPLSSFANPRTPPCVTVPGKGSARISCSTSGIAMSPYGSESGQGRSSALGIAGALSPARRCLRTISAPVTKRTFAAAYLTGRIWSCPAAQETKKLPFSKISWPMSGKESVADAVAPDLHRQLRPISVNWPSGSFRSTAVVRLTAPKSWRPAAIG